MTIPQDSPSSRAAHPDLLPMQRQRAQALLIARDALKATGFASAHVEGDSAALVHLANYIVTGETHVVVDFAGGSGPPILVGPPRVPSWMSEHFETKGEPDGG